MTSSTYTSLMDALQSNNPRAFHSILQLEGLPRGCWWLDYELLTKALKLNRKHIVDYLLESGCCVWKPHDKTSPLHMAVAKANWFDVVDKLLCLGARVSAKDDAGDTTVHVAFKNHASSKVLDSLIQSYLDETSVSIGDKEELGVLHIACTRPELDFVKKFFHFHRTNIDSQVSMDSDSSYAGYTPLHFAVEHGRHEIAEYLLQRGADLHVQDRNGSTALHLALEYCDVKMIDLICDYISKYEDIVNNRGLSHFMAACAATDSSLVERYLTICAPDSPINDRVMDLSGYPFAGFTPLHFAAVYGRRQAVRLLLCCHGEELFWAATARNHTASSLAFEAKQYRIVQLFATYCEGGSAWMKEVDKIAEDSVVRDMMLGLHEESFRSCMDFDQSEIMMELEDNCVIDGHVNQCDVIDDLNDTILLEDFEENVDHEQSIQLTPRSTRSLIRKPDEVFMSRLQDMQKMSKRFLFDVNLEDNEDCSENSKLDRFISSAAKPARFLLGTLFFISLMIIVPVPNF